MYTHIHFQYKLQISYEFSLRYPNEDEFAFQNAWNMLSRRAVNVFESYYATKFKSSWTKDIDQLLVLLKMLPTKAAGKNLAQIESSFAKAEQKLIIFRMVKLLYFNIIILVCLLLKMLININWFRVEKLSIDGLGAKW